MAFSRPGLLTFKTDAADQSPALGAAEPDRQIEPPEHWLIRQSGVAIGQFQGDTAENLVAEVLERAGRKWDAVHVFARDRDLPGNRGFEPGHDPLCAEIEALFRIELPDATVGVCKAAAQVLDVVVIQPDRWIVGFHRAGEIQQRWPGGVYPLSLPTHIVSRAYRKTAEAVAWSQFPFRAGDALVEIGSSPGGASQRFLDLGLVVTGIDPAEMDPLILEHPRFTHWRGKSSGIKRKLYQGFRWLSADANVAPNYTLDAIEDIVTYPTSQFEGLLLTLKLSSYELADQMEQYLARIRGWGFAEVKVRQLSPNRRECCVAARRAAGWRSVDR